MFPSDMPVITPQPSGTEFNELRLPARDQHGVRPLRIAILLAATLCVFAGVACDAPAKAPTPVYLRFTTGIPGAGFHPLGAALARAYAVAFPDVSFEVLESAGSVRNVQAIERGAADLGFSFADVAYAAYTGRLEEEPVPFERLRGIAVLQLTPLHIVVRAHVPIRRIGDLRGHRVGVGPPGSGTALTSELVLRAYGIGANDVVVEHLAFNDAAEQILAGTLDAAFVNGGYPAESVTTVTRAGGHLLPIEGTPIDRLRAEYPFLRPTFIPKDTYPTNADVVPTVGLANVLICHENLDEALVYRLTEGLFEALPALSSERVSLRSMDVEQASATPIPLHDGAARYYREQELFR